MFVKSLVQHHSGLSQVQQKAALYIVPCVSACKSLFSVSLLLIAVCHGLLLYIKVPNWLTTVLQKREEILESVAWPNFSLVQFHAHSWPDFLQSVTYYLRSAGATPSNK